MADTTAELLEAVKRVEHKLDTLIAALAAGEDDQPEASLDDGRTFQPRKARQGLG